MSIQSKSNTLINYNFSNAWCQKNLTNTVLLKPFLSILLH